MTKTTIWNKSFFIPFSKVRKKVVKTHKIVPKLFDTALKKLLMFMLVTQRYTKNAEKSSHTTKYLGETKKVYFVLLQLFLQYHILCLQLQYITPKSSAKHSVLLSFTGFYVQMYWKI